MKRGWFGAALLLILLGLGVGSSSLMEVLHRPLADALDMASEWALEENWEGAAETARQAEASWRKLWHFSAILSDHEPMEEIDALFGQLEIYRAEGDSLSFAAACASLSRQVEAIADAHGLSWWNLL